MKTNAETRPLAAKPTLGDLVVRGSDLQDEDLARALHGRVGLPEKKDRVTLVGEFAGAGAKKKLVAVGLARHAMLRQGWIKEDQLSAPSEWYAVQTQQRPKSVGEELSRLKKEGLMERAETGWSVPPWALRLAIEFLDE